MSPSIKIFVFIVGFMQVILLLAHYVLYRFGIGTFSVLEKNRYIFGVVMILLSLSFTVGMMLVQKFENTLTGYIYYFASVWLGTIFWLFLAVIISVVVRYFIPIESGMYVFIPGILVAMAFAVSAYGVYHGSDSVFVKRDISVKNLPDSWQGRTAVFMADTHYGNIHGKAKAERDLAIIRSVNPDILFVSGDFFDGPKKDLHVFSDVYKDFNPPYGKYFASGNHEEYAGMSASIDALKSAGFIILDNQNIDVGGVQLLGVPYTTNAKSDADATATTGVLSGFMYDHDSPSILLKHIPINTDIIKDAGVSFAFFGHTHRGQAWPMTLIVKKIYGEHAYGFVQKDDTLFYTTSGLGGWGPPQRIGSDSELLLATFNKK
ncbi:MAG: metallophosphoesterase [Candidatus Paceibacterota bacterium]